MTTTRQLAPHFHCLADSHPLAKLIAKDYRWYSPAFSPRDVPAFADVGSLTESPAVMNGIRDFLVKRYRSLPQPPTHIVGFDARGFLFGPLVAAALNIPFVLMRKAGKNAGLLIKSEPYEKEYKEEAPEVMTIRAGSIARGSRVVLIDDVLATGGTALSGLQLVEASGATVVEMATVIALPFLKPVEMIHNFDNGRYKNVEFFTLTCADVLTKENCGDLVGYKGPRVVSCKEAPSVLAHL